MQDKPIVEFTQLNTVDKFGVRQRHIFGILSFFCFVIIPVCIVTYYMLFRALDQYTSTVAFTVRSEEISSAVDILGGLRALGSGSSSDTDILYEYIQSITMLKELKGELDLNRIYSANFKIDPLYAFNPSGSLEDLGDYWPRMVKVFYDKGTGLIEVKVHAFEPAHSKKIAEAIYQSSSDMINKISAVAREDSIKYARDELDRALELLQNVRAKMVLFRSEYQLVDPETELGMQAGVINALQSQLSELLIENDLLISSSTSDDPRLEEIQERINIVNLRIAEERSKFSSQDENYNSYSKLVSEYEELMVEKEYAERAYLASRTAYDAALIEAQRKSRYLAQYITPTTAESSQYPQRIFNIFLTFLGSLMIWMVVILVFYSIKDRR